MTLAGAAEPPLHLCKGGSLACQICIRAQAGPWETRAAQDLASYIQKITGQRPQISNTTSPDSVNLILGELALQKDRGLRRRLDEVKKKNPVLRADAIAWQARGHDFFLAGSNDDSHYFAVAELLRRWGCRFYLPADWGECIPHLADPLLPDQDFAYAPPFEVRSYWIAWGIYSPQSVGI